MKVSAKIIGRMYCGREKRIRVEIVPVFHGASS